VECGLATAVLRDVRSCAHELAPRRRLGNLERRRNLGQPHALNVAQDERQTTSSSELVEDSVERLQRLPTLRVTRENAGIRQLAGWRQHHPTANLAAAKLERREPDRDADEVAAERRAFLDALRTFDERDEHFLKQVFDDEIGTERAAQDPPHEPGVAIPDDGNCVRITASGGLDELGIAEAFRRKARNLPRGLRGERRSGLRADF